MGATKLKIIVSSRERRKLGKMLITNLRECGNPAALAQG
jgi:hypothetical protein